MLRGVCKRRRVAGVLISAAAGVVIAVLSPVQATAATLVTLYNFCAQDNCTDGSQPLGTLLLDGSGNLYGTTLHGGAPPVLNNGAYGCGTVWQVAPDGTQTVLHSFEGQPCGARSSKHDGIGPYSDLVMDGNGDLFSTTLSGGAHGASLGWGTVFEIPPGGRSKSIYQFCDQKKCTDGHQPIGPVIMDPAGNLYGTTMESGETGGPPNGGTVFMLTPNRAGTKWKETTLYTFPNNITPSAGLVMDAAGNLYGTTSGPSGDTQTGTAFELTANGDGTFSQTTIYNFCSQPNCSDGAWPFGGLIVDGAGNLYGTTEGGGDRQFGDGTIFDLTPDGSGKFTETVLYRFCKQQNCTDGFLPMGGLLLDGAGNLYGTTYYGGTGGVTGIGAGTAYKLTPGGTLTVLYSFGSAINFSDGRNPQAGLIMDGAGNLYGATSAGGTHYDASISDYGGTIFMLTP